jgi:hypothetical protein
MSAVTQTPRPDVSPAPARAFVFAILLAVLSIVALPVPAASQAQHKAAAGNGSIFGSVADQNGAVIPGAKLVLSNAAGVKLEGKSDEKGDYKFTGLHSGTYNLSVIAPNLPALNLEYISLTAGQKLQMDASLQGELPKAATTSQPMPVVPPPAPEAGVSAQSATNPSAPTAASNQSSALAQATTSSPIVQAGADKGSISGVASDQTGAVIVGAKVVLSNAAGQTWETQTDLNGSYKFTGVDPGTYKLLVTAPNFADQSMTDITVAAAAVPLDVSLQPAKSSEQVNVVGQTVGQVEVETASVSGTITEKEVVKIGLNGRNFTQLIALAPGVSNQTGQDEAKVGVQGSVKYSVNGGRVEYNTFDVDGSDVLNTGLNGAASTLMVYPSLDAIQEVKVLTSNYGAQYGRTASGTVQVTTKSGGDKLHGNLYEFIRNEFFNSRNYFDPGTKAPLYRRQDFGGTVGGPVAIPHLYNPAKKKTFFFFSEEFRLEKTPTEYNQAVPSLKERGLIMTPQGVRENLVQGSGGTFYQDFDFTDVCPLPGTTGQNSATGFSRSVFPDCPSLPLNGIPSNMLVPLNHLQQPAPAPGLTSQTGVDKNALAILNSNLIPLPNSPVGCNYSIANIDPTDPNRCYNAAVSPSTYWRQELFRIDHDITPMMKASFRYIHDQWDTTVLAPQWSILRTTNPSAATFPTVQNRFVGPGTSLVARLTNTISPTLLNDLVLSYTNSIITLVDKNGPGGAIFQRDPTLGRPLVPDASAPGQCNPAISNDPTTSIPQCAMGYIFNNGFGGKMPTAEILGTNAVYGGRGFAIDAGYMPWGHTNPTYSLRDDVFKSKGQHTFQFGGQVVYSQRNQDNNAIGAASGETQGLLIFDNLVHSTGNAFADFLLQDNHTGTPQGFIQSFSQDSAKRRYYQRFTIGEPYFQDDWKVTKRLTLNLGLRVSLFGTYQEKNKNAWNWESARFNRSRFAVDPCSGVLLDKTVATNANCNGTVLPGAPVLFNASTFALDPSVVTQLGLVQCGKAGTPASCMKGHLFNPAPRVGFAWDPRGNGKTSIRGGYGIFFEHGTGNEANTGSLEASSPLVLSVTQPLPVSYPCIGNVGYGATVDPNNTACNIYPLSTAPPAGAVYPLNVTAIPNKAVWPYAQQWSFGIQQELARNVIGTMSYVGSRGTHLTLERNLNQMVPLPLSQNPFGPNEPLTIDDCTVSPVQGATFPGDGVTPFQLQSGTIITPQSPAYVHMQAACASPNLPKVNSLPRPYAGLGQVLSLENVANSTYHAMQATIRRITGQLTVGASYSYSHSIDDSSDRSDPILVDSYNLRGNRASSNFDQRHLATISYIYNLSGFPKWLEQATRGHAGDPTGDGQDEPLPSKSSRWLHLFADGWEISGVTLLETGTPFTVINSAGNTGISQTDNAGVSSGFGIAESYPDVTAGALRSSNNPQSVGPLLRNPAQFVAPRGLTFGNAGRNFLNNPGRVNFDMALLRHFKPTESSSLEFRAEFFNIFNHTQFRIYDPDNAGGTGNNVVSCYAGPFYSAGFQGAGGADCITGASFLHPLNAHRPRTMQFGLKWSF